MDISAAVGDFVGDLGAFTVGDRPGPAPGGGTGETTFLGELVGRRDRLGDRCNLQAPNGTVVCGRIPGSDGQRAEKHTRSRAGRTTVGGSALLVSTAARKLIATYRVQMRAGVDFARLTEHLGYIARLGPSHLYLSPIFTACTGSTHGYDVTRPDQIDPALGGIAGFEALARNAARHGLGIVLDIVPNHMAASTENPWWRDVLEHGRDSRFARFFDIDWDMREVAGKVALPVLAAPFDRVLEQGAIRVEAGAAEGPVLLVSGQRLPLRPESRRTLQGGDLDEVNADRAALRQLIREQHYVPVFWRALPDRLNWRRFFDISGLVGLRIEQEEVFEAVHRLVFDLVARGLVHGLRIDHVDGLADPAGYLRRLRARLEEHGAGPRFPVWVEKILGPGEKLRRSWPVSGTTGYEVMNDILHVACDPGASRVLGALWRKISADRRSFSRLIVETKREVLERLFSGEHARLARFAAALAADRARPVEVGEIRLALALREVFARLPVYRTYTAGGGIEPDDRAVLEKTFAQTAEETRGAFDDILGFLQELLLDPADAQRRRFAARFSQLSGPLAAKAVEDTAFYRYLRFVAANEVGGEPGAIGLPTARFHARQRARARTWPHHLVPIATHDHKRGADVRARLAVLTEIPRVFAAHVALWRRTNRKARGEIDAAAEYLLYQTLVGSLPLELSPADRVGLAVFADRIAACMQKSVREAKLRTSWTEPDRAWEAALERFVRRILDPDESTIFLSDLHAFVARIAPAGAANGLVYRTLAATLPGIPDIYWGSERRDLSLVDPDNRRPADFPALETSFDPDARPEELLRYWQDGRIHQWLTARLLVLRRQWERVFAGGYRGLKVTGTAARHLLAFERFADGERLIVAVLRYPFAAGVRDTDLAADPERLRSALLQIPGTDRVRDLVADRELPVEAGQVSAACLLSGLPVVVLVPE